jgi:hypothetical protein
VIKLSEFGVSREVSADCQALEVAELLAVHEQVAALHRNVGFDNFNESWSHTDHKDADHEVR